MAEQNNVIAYRCGGIPIRSFFVNDDLWFSSSDIADALAVEHADVVASFPVMPLGDNESAISESSVFSLIVGANSTAALSLKKWLAFELFPTLYRDAYITVLRARINELKGLSGADGKRSSYRRLTDEEKAEIRKLKEEGWTTQGLSRKFRRGDTTILAVLKGGW